MINRKEVKTNFSAGDEVRLNTLNREHFPLEIKIKFVTENRMKIKSRFTTGLNASLAATFRFPRAINCGHAKSQLKGLRDIKILSKRNKKYFNSGYLRIKNQCKY